MKKVLDTYADKLGDMINLDFAPKGAAAPAAIAAAAVAKPPAAPASPRTRMSAAELARAAAKKNR